MRGQDQVFLLDRSFKAVARKGEGQALRQRRSGKEPQNQGCGSELRLQGGWG